MPRQKAIPVKKVIVDEESLWEATSSRFDKKTEGFHVFDDQEDDEVQLLDDREERSEVLHKKVKRHRESPIVLEYTVTDAANEDVKMMAGQLLESSRGSAEEYHKSKLGEFAFRTFTSAARIDAINKGNVSIVPTEGDTTFTVMYKSLNKKYEDKIQNMLSASVIQLIMKEVLERSSTKRRRNESGLRNIFSLKELADRAPWLLWSVVKLFGVSEFRCEMGISELIEKVLE